MAVRRLIYLAALSGCGIFYIAYGEWFSFLALVLMLVLPWLAVTFVQSDAGMAVVLVLFLAINPGHSMASGYYAGKQIRRLWWVPAVSSALFLAGAWPFFEMGELAFLTYAGIYFALGMEAMLVSRLITVRRENDG